MSPLPSAPSSSFSSSKIQAIERFPFNIYCIEGILPPQSNSLQVFLFSPQSRWDGALTCFPTSVLSLFQFSPRVPSIRLTSLGCCSDGLVPLPPDVHGSCLAVSVNANLSLPECGSTFQQFPFFLPLLYSGSETEVFADGHISSESGSHLSLFVITMLCPKLSYPSRVAQMPSTSLQAHPSILLWSPIMLHLYRSWTLSLSTLHDQ